MAPKYKLTYLNMRGLGEPIRFLLEYGGVDWEDIRLEKGPQVKEIGPFGKVPVLEVDGMKFHQSGAICRYLAKQFKLVGDSDWEAAQVDMIIDTVKDMTTAVVAAAPIIHGSQGKEAGEKKLHEIANETLPFFYSRFEEIVHKNGGHFVNGKLTLADFVWTHYSLKAKGFHGVDLQGKYPHLDALEEKVLQLPAIKAWIARRPDTAH